MGKFFNKGPKIKICSICNEEKEVFKTMRQGLTAFHYCKECYNGTYKRIEDRAKQQVMDAVKSGKLLSISDITELTKTITAEIEAENEVKKNGEKNRINNSEKEK